MKSFVACLGMLALVFAFTGCGGGDDKKDDKKDDKTAKKDDHAHDHHHGPNGQPVFELEELGLHGELVVKKTSKKVAVEFCSEGGKAPEAVKADKVVISYNGKEYELTAVDAKDGKAVRYEIEDEELKLIAKNKPNITVTVGDKSETAEKVGTH